MKEFESRKIGKLSIRRPTHEKSCAKLSKFDDPSFLYQSLNLIELTQVERVLT